MGTVRFHVNGYLMEQMVSIGMRLREERQRLDVNQTQLGECGGVTKKTQMLYEAGERFPDAAYLAAIANAGADIQYVVTGVRSDAALTPDERELLALYRAAPLAGKMAAVGALQGVISSSTAPKKVGTIIHGEVGQQVGKNTGRIKITMGERKK